MPSVKGAHRRHETNAAAGAPRVVAGEACLGGMGRHKEVGHYG